MSHAERVMLDSNVPMYAAGQQHEYREPCQRVLALVLADQLAALTNTEVHQEILHRYLAIGLGEKARQVSEDFQAIVSAILPVTIEDIVRARELAERYTGLPARDLVHVSVMLNNGVHVVVSADRHFDQVTEITRLDPREVSVDPL